MIANTEKKSAVPLLRQAVALIRDSGRTALLDDGTARLLGRTRGAARTPQALSRLVGVLIVFGGDGTMLRITRAVGGQPTPILGINVGGLGFLTAVPPERLKSALRSIWSGNYEIETRPLIQAEGTACGKPFTTVAFNDFVVTRGIISRLVELDVSVDGVLVTRYRCDGLIVSSPTGSTAYSLAAGGAVVHPTAEVFAITPICPHTLSNRSVIVGLNSTIDVRVASVRPETILSADGQSVSALHAGDLIRLSKSTRCVNLIRLDGSSFFETLRIKLHWSGSNV